MACGVSLGALVLLPGVAAAQTAQPAVVGEIIVTAQRRAENVQNVPMSVSALGRDAIQSRGIQSVQDLQTAVAGLKFGSFSGGDNITIRGVGSAFVSGAGQSSVAEYIDGVYLSQLESLGMGQADIGSIEVLKGPQGTLYGRNSTGGVINFTTNGPTRDASYGGVFEIGNYNHTKEEAYVSGPISDNVRGRLFVQKTNTDGYITDTITGQKLNNTDSFGGRISIDSDVTDAWLVQLRLSSWRDKFAGPVYDGFDQNFVLIPPPYTDLSPYRVASPVHYDSERLNNIVSIKNSVRISDGLKLVATTGFNDFSQREFLDALGNSLASYPLASNRRAQTFTQEINLNGESDTTKWVAGVYYLHQYMKQTSMSDQTAVAGLSGPRTVIGPPASSLIQYDLTNSTIQSASVFGDVTYKIRTGTSVYGGARISYDTNREDLTEGVSAFGTVVNNCTPATDPLEVSGVSFSGRIGVQQSLSPDSMAYLQLSRGFKAPGFSESQCRNPFAKETINAVELGYKSQWFGRRLTFNTSAFYYDYRNLQLEQATLTGIPVVNAPKARVFGAEAQIVASPVDRVRIDASLALLNSEYQEFINQDPFNGVPLGTSLAGVQLNNAPTASGNLGVEVDQGLADFGKITWRVETVASTSYHLREFNEPYAIQNAYAMVNLFATWRAPNGHLQIRAFAKNVGNVALLMGELGFGGALGSFGAPRMYGVETRLSF